MKKLIALLLSLTMVVCLVACGNQNNNTPSTNDGSSVSSETPSQDGTSSKHNGIPAVGTDAGACSAPLASPYRLYKEHSEYTEFTYDYIGISYKLPQEIKDKLTNGEMTIWVDTNWMSSATDFNYSIMYFHAAEGENLTEDMLTGPTDDEYYQWLGTTKRVGTITVVNSEYLKENTVENITECEENEEIGRSSDGRYVFYLSTNEVEGVTEQFKTIEITTFDPKAIPEGKPGTCDPFDFYGGSRK